MKRRKPGKALERIAREIKNSAEFLDHVAGISELYRKEQALDATPRSAAVRQSVKTFRKHATALTEWFAQAQKTNQSPPEQDALDKIGIIIYGTSHQAHAASRSVAAWLAQADAAAGRCLDDAQLLPRKPQRNGPKAAGAALRATFEHHKLKFSLRAGGENMSDAVRLLCSIAKNAGDPTLTPAEAKQALKESARNEAKTRRKG